MLPKTAILVRRGMGWATDPRIGFLETDVRELEQETDVEFFVAGGPGGQHRNKTASGVRLLHRPTGLRAQATERRSQHQNLAVAFQRLTRLIEERNRPKKPRKATRPTRASVRRRLNDKQRRAKTKRNRNLSDWDD